MPDSQSTDIAPPRPDDRAHDAEELSKPFPWRRIRRWVVWLATTIPTSILAVWFIVTLSALVLHRYSLDIDAIGVPETLEKAGFTSEVATRRLLDAILEVENSALTSMAKPDLEADSDWSRITISQTGLTLQGVAAAIRNFFPSWRREISGEFVESGSKLSLRVRFNGKAIFSGSTDAVDAESAEQLIAGFRNGAAFAIVQATEPYLSAAALFGNGTNVDFINDAENAAEEIIARLPTNDENVLRAYDLRGLIAHLEQHNCAAAIAFYEHARGLSVTHNNLALVYSDRTCPMYDLRHAAAESEAALHIDPGVPALHFVYGSILRDSGEIANSIAQLKTAIRLATVAYKRTGETDKVLPYAYFMLGNDFFDLHNFAGSRDEYLDGLALDPANFPALNQLGRAFLGLEQPNEALTEFKAAAALDPRDGTPYYNMALALEALAESPGPERTQQLQKACDALIEGSKLVDSDPDFRAQMKDIDDMMDGVGHCVP